jgi:hypothetical protein
LPIGRARTAMPKASDDHAPAPSAILVYTPIVLERGPAQRLDVSILKAFAPGAASGLRYPENHFVRLGIWQNRASRLPEPLF